MSYDRATVARPSFPLTVAAAGTTVTSAAMGLNGILVGLTAIVPALDNAATLAVSVADADGTVLYNKSGIAAPSQTAFLIDVNNMYLRIPVSGAHTVTVTTSAAQTTQKAVTVKLLISK